MTNTHSRLVRSGVALAMGVVAASCTEPKPKPAAIAAATPLSMTSVVGLAVAVPPAVKVTDAKGGGVGGVAVTFAITAGGGTLTSSTTTSKDDGLASPGGWTLGTTAGTNTVVASVEGLTGSPVTFTATGTPGPPASVVLNAGDAQSANVNTPVIISPSVRVLDANSNAVSNVAVTFAVASGNGTVVGAAATTSALGIATLGSWTLGPTPGANTLSASVVGVSSAVTFSATGTPTPQALSVVSGPGDRQAVMTSAAVVTKPSVTVTSNGAPAPGVTVTFTVSTGGGSVTGGTAVTDANGVATVGSWTLGATPGLNTLMASVAGSNVTGNPISFTASGCTGGGANYKLTLCFTSDMTPSQRTAFTAAATRWETIITADVPDVALGASPLPAGACGSGSFSLAGGTVFDDLLIFASVVAIDGPGGILGSAGPCLLRSPSPGLPAAGTMRFDAADVQGLEGNGSFNSVILHEMGHVIGIGSRWESFGFLQLKSTVGQSPTIDTHYNGPNGIAGFNEIGGSTYTQGNKVPVENATSAGAGTVNSHWREGVLNNELMTGFLNSGTNPLSVLTIRSLADFGYVVNPAVADPFFLTLSFATPMASGPTIRLLDDAYTGQQHTIDSRGVLKRIR